MRGLRYFLYLTILVVPGVAADISKSTAAPPAGRTWGAFQLELQAPDTLTAAQGVGPCIELWTKQILAARRHVTVIGSDLSAPWIKPLIDLREQRPEVDVHVIAARPSLGTRGEVADSLVAAGIKVFFTTPLASLGGFPTLPHVRGLIVVRDGASVIMVSGATAQDGWTNAWLIESTPMAEAYNQRIEQIRNQLPRYPESREILISDQ